MLIKELTVRLLDRPPGHCDVPLTSMSAESCLGITDICGVHCPGAGAGGEIGEASGSSRLPPRQGAATIPSPRTPVHAQGAGRLELTAAPAMLHAKQGKDEMNVFSEQTNDPMWRLVRKGTAVASSPITCGVPRQQPPPMHACILRPPAQPAWAE